MKRNKKDPTELIVNVDAYKLGNRSGNTNDPNREDDPTYIVRLIKKVVTVSVEKAGV